MGRLHPVLGRVWNRLSSLYLALSALACAATACSFLGRLWWFLELSCHFRVQYAAILVPAVAVAALRRQFKAAAVLGVFALANVVVILPLYFGRSEPAATGHPLRVVLLNVHTANRDSAAVLEFLENTQADLIALLEVNGRWMRDLQPLEDDYAFSRTLPREDNFGITLFSLMAPEESAITWIGEADVPSIVARFQIGDQPLTVIATHPVPPVNRLYAADRNRQLTAVAKLAAEQKDPVLLLGDLNTTSWSPYFSDLLQQSGLDDSRAGFGVQPTWPSGRALLWIPLDHCLVSPSITVRDRRVGPFVGSDHYPVIVELEL